MAEIEPDFPIFVGRCIYCRASDGRLSDEHIIPYALNGEWILQKASCEACAKATSRLELELLRGDLLPLRTRLGLRTRRKHERPRALPFKYKRGDAMMLTELPVDEHPAPIALPIFRLPVISRPSVQIATSCSCARSARSNLPTKHLPGSSS